MPVLKIIFYGISGTVIAGLLTSWVLMRFEFSEFSVAAVIAFLLFPAFACLFGGLRDYRVAVMIVVYSSIGFVIVGAMRPVAAIGPAHRELYHAKRQLAGDIGEWQAITASCSLAIGRILFIRRKQALAESNHETTEKNAG